MTDWRSELARARVLPVVTTIDVESTLAMAAALERGGMRAVEITLRSDAALDSLRALRDAGSALRLVAGTVLNAADVDAALEAGAEVLVSPGATPQLLQAAQDASAALIPGVATASDVMRGLEFGHSLFKLFPAVPAGGLGLLRALGGPFPAVQFCPTGGLNEDNFRDYLALDNVLCCGGSWMVKESLVAAGEWDQIEALARNAMQVD